jgi:hypothetical protein
VVVQLSSSEKRGLSSLRRRELGGHLILLNAQVKKRKILNFEIFLKGKLGSCLILMFV